MFFHEGTEPFDGRIADIDALGMHFRKPASGIFYEHLHIDPRPVAAAAVKLRAQCRSGIARGDEDERLAR